MLPAVACVTEGVCFGHNIHQWREVRHPWPPRTTLWVAKVLKNHILTAVSTLFLN
jgi:hypothetical protein